MIYECEKPFCTHGISLRIFIFRPSLPLAVPPDPVVDHYSTVKRYEVKYDLELSPCGLFYVPRCM